MLVFHHQQSIKERLDRGKERVEREREREEESDQETPTQTISN